MIGSLRTRVRKQPIIVLYFKFKTVLKFYNLRTRLPHMRVDQTRSLGITNPWPQNDYYERSKMDTCISSNI